MNFFLDSGSYYGQMVMKRHINNLIISETSYISNTQIPHHYHKNFYLCYVVKGSYQEHYLNKKVVCAEGNIIVRPNGFEHANSFDKNTGICFNIEFLNSSNSDIDLTHIPYQKLQRSILAAPIEKMYKEFKFNDDFSSIIMEGLALETIGKLGRLAKDIGPYWLKKAKEVVIQTNGPVSLSAIASQLHISAAHLAREFKKANGVTFGEYVRTVRVQQACSMIKNGKADLLEVALQHGFADQSHFTRTFKKVMNSTPLQFKKAIR